MALRNMIVRVGADVTGLNKGMRQASSTLSGFASSLNKTLSGIQGKMLAGMAGVGGGLIVQSAVEDAMKYESLMTTLGESLGSSRKQFEDWSATTGRSMGFSRLQSAELANTLSLNFKKIAVSQEDLTNKTTKMMEMAGIIANKRGITMEEVSDRIRSAMNQEADGADELGVNVRIAAIKTSDAYKTMADGKPWDQLSQHMQKTILYEHIIQQVTENLGATIQDTTQLRMAQFTASLYDVRLALGQAFLPIMYQVLPYLTKLMDYLYKALTYFTAFSKAIFGGFKFNPKAQQAQIKATQAQTTAVGDLGKAQEKTAKKTAKAQKEANRGVAGFDEVNLLSESGGAGAGAGGAGAGAGGAGGMAQPETPPMPTTSFMEEADKLVGKMKKMFAPIIEPLKSAWKAIAGFVKEQMKGIADWWDDNSEQIMQAIKNVWKFLKPIVKFIVKFVWDSIKGLVEGVIQFFEGIIEFFTGVFTGDWGKAWEGIKDMFFGAFKAIMNFLNLSVIGGIKKIFLSIAESGVKAFLSLVTKSKSTWEGLWTGVKTTATSYLDDAWRAIKGKFDDWVTALYVYGDDMIKAITSKLSGIGSWFKTNVTDKFVSYMSGIKDDVATKAGDVWTAIKGKFSKAYEFFRDDVVKAPYNAFINWKNGIANKAGDVWTAIKEKFSAVKDWFYNKVIKPIKDAFADIKAGFSAGLGSGIKAIINTGIRYINSIITTMNKVLDAVDKVTPGKIGNIPKIKELAKGGIATSATLAVVGEGSQPEAIAPIDKLQGYVTNAVLSALRFQGGGGGGTTGDIVLNLDGRTFARIIKPHMDKEAQRIGGNVKFNPI